MSRGWGPLEPMLTWRLAVLGTQTWWGEVVSRETSSSTLESTQEFRFRCTQEKEKSLFQKEDEEKMEKETDSDR